MLAECAAERRRVELQTLGLTLLSRAFCSGRSSECPGTRALLSDRRSHCIVASVHDVVCQGSHYALDLASRDL